MRALPRSSQLASVVVSVWLGTTGCGPATGADPGSPGGAAPPGASQSQVPNATSSGAAPDGQQAAPASTTAPAGSPGGPPSGPAIAYPMGDITPIADDCKDATAVVTTAPRSVGWDYEWIWTRQALYANPQFQIISWPDAPDAAMEVRMDVYEWGDAFALVAKCGDGATCNQLAAMYKRTVPSCAPVLYCGPPPLEGPPRRSNIIPADGKWLPADTTGKCARIGTCIFMHERFVQGNPGLDCQSRPATFDLGCALEPSCSDVMACLKR